MRKIFDQRLELKDQFWKAACEKKFKQTKFKEAGTPVNFKYLTKKRSVDTLWASTKYVAVAMCDIIELTLIFRFIVVFVDRVENLCGYEVPHTHLQAGIGLAYNRCEVRS